MNKFTKEEFDAIDHHEIEGDQKDFIFRLIDTVQELYDQGDASDGEIRLL